jgi:hypothetical protein
MKEKQSAIRKKIARIINYRQRFKAISSHNQVSAKKLSVQSACCCFIS